MILNTLSAGGPLVDCQVDHLLPGWHLEDHLVNPLKGWLVALLTGGPLEGWLVGPREGGPIDW